MILNDDDDDDVDGVKMLWKQFFWCAFLSVVYQKFTLVECFYVSYTQVLGWK